MLAELNENSIRLSHPNFQCRSFSLIFPRERIPSAISTREEAQRWEETPDELDATQILQSTGISSSVAVIFLRQLSRFREQTRNQNQQRDDNNSKHSPKNVANGATQRFRYPFRFESFLRAKRSRHSFGT